MSAIYSNRHQWIRTVLFSFALGSMLGGCGQIGPLFLPDAAPQEQPADKPQNTEDAGDAERE